MRAANIVSGFAVAIWLALALVGRNLISGVVGQKTLGYPSMGQVDFLIAGPLLVVATVLVCAWICNAFQRWAWALGLLSTTALGALLPYLFVYGAGV